MTIKHRLLAAVFNAAVATTSLLTANPALAAPAVTAQTTVIDPSQVRFGTINIDGLNIAYREAGDPRLPKLVLLHGWPSSSHQFRDLIPALSQRFHVIAPDYQGFGNSDHPDPATYHYSFDAISVTIEKFLAAKGFDHYGLFVQDYGGPVGFRIVTRNPQSLDWLVIQNSNAYEVGFTPAWDGFRKALWINRTPESEKPLAGFNTPEAIRNIVYLGGAGHPELIAPEAYQSDAASVAGPTNLRIQLDLFYDYRHNPELYPQWQKFLRERQPKTVIFWGQHDPFFSPAGGEAFLKDLPKAEMHRLNAGHFATEDNLPYIAGHIISFYDKNVKAEEIGRACPGAAHPPRRRPGVKLTKGDLDAQVPRRAARLDRARYDRVPRHHLPPAHPATGSTCVLTGSRLTAPATSQTRRTMT